MTDRKDNHHSAIPVYRTDQKRDDSGYHRAGPDFMSSLSTRTPSGLKAQNKDVGVYMHKYSFERYINLLQIAGLFGASGKQAVTQLEQMCRDASLAAEIKNDNIGSSSLPTKCETYDIKNEDMLGYINDVCKILENPGDLTEVKEFKIRKHFPFSRIENIRRARFDNGQIVIEFKNSSEKRTARKRPSKKQKNREANGIVSPGQKINPELVLGGPSDDEIKSVCLATATKEEHYAHIVIQLTCRSRWMIDGAPLVVDKDGTERHVTMNDSTADTVELKRSQDYPDIFMDKGRPMFTRVYKINVIPILFLVKRAGRWLIATHYFLCYAEKQNMWHLMADYDPHADNDPMVDRFNSSKTCDIGNFLNVVKYMCSLGKGFNTERHDGTWERHQLDPEKGMVVTPSEAPQGPPTGYHYKSLMTDPVSNLTLQLCVKDKSN
jgi:hypothetical protein